MVISKEKEEEDSYSTRANCGQLLPEQIPHSWRDDGGYGQDGGWFSNFGQKVNYTT